MKEKNLLSKILTELVNELGFSKKKLLYIGGMKWLPKFVPFEGIKYSEIIKSSAQSPAEFFNENKIKKKFDFVYADLPWSIRRLDERILCLNILDHLHDGGLAGFLMPGYSRTFKGHGASQFLNSLNEKGFKVTAVIQMPDQLLGEFTKIAPTLILISHKTDIQETFFSRYRDGEYHELQIKMTSFGVQQVFDEVFRSELKEHEDKNIKEAIQFEENLFDGLMTTIPKFDGFDHWEITKIISSMESKYGYKLISFQELRDKGLIEINRTQDTFEEKENDFYINSLEHHGLKGILDEMPEEDSIPKPRFYFQVVIKTHKIKKKFVINFLQSSFGRKILRAEFSKVGSTIPRLSLNQFIKIRIPIPNLGVQQENIENLNKLHSLQSLLMEIEDSLSIKPMSSAEQIAKLDQIYESSIELSESEKFYNDIKRGESIDREFKSTFAVDVKTKKREDHLIFSCIKTIAGMLNAHGGTLYIGVADNSDITGLEVEIGKKQLYKTMDKYINAIKDMIKKQLSASSLKNIEYIPLTIHEQQILAIKCVKSAHQVFVKGKDTYVRVGPSTELLEGPDLITYSKERFD